MQHQFYSLKQVADIVGGKLIGNGAKQQICDLLIDSRHLINPSQTLFFALKTSKLRCEALFILMENDSLRLYVCFVVLLGDTS